MKSSASSQDLYDGEILLERNSDTINKQNNPCYLFCINIDVLVSSQNPHHFYFYIYKHILIDWVPREADFETETNIWAFLRKCSEDQHGGGGEEGRRMGQREKLCCDVSSMQDL